MVSLRSWFLASIRNSKINFASRIKKFSQMGHIQQSIERSCRLKKCCNTLKNLLTLLTFSYILQALHPSPLGIFVFFSSILFIPPLYSFCVISTRLTFGEAMQKCLYPLCRLARMCWFLFHGVGTYWFSYLRNEYNTT